MNILITGGAGFIGCWVTKKFLEKEHQVMIFDNLSNGNKANLMDFEQRSNYRGMTIGDISNVDDVKSVFSNRFDLCIHLAAQINVNESLVNPEKSFQVNTFGTYNILESSLVSRTKVVIIGTCMVYDVAVNQRAINEEHLIKPRSPYAGSKLAAENVALSYFHAFGLPVVILRPFNVFGPKQKGNTEGGVVSIFINNNLNNEPLKIFGDGTQTRDFMYVEDCADFIYEASLNTDAEGEIINAGSGSDTSINDLAKLIVKNDNQIIHVEHPNLQSEIKKLLCDYSKAHEILGWQPKVTLEEGLERTKEWIITQKE